MDEKLLMQILAHDAFIKESKGVFSAKDEFEITVILATQTASSINKIKSVEISGPLCTLSTNESTYLMPWSQIFAIRISEEATVQTSRTGFHA